MKIIDQNSTGYTVQCIAIDNESGIDRVQFPTWTLNNDQDDIFEEWSINSKASGSINNNMVTYQVKISDHNNELGYYRTHIYVYDKCGNSINVSVPDVNIQKYYKVYFDANGGTTDVVCMSINYGGTYDELANASREGYRFLGWYTEKEGRTLIKNDTVYNLTTDQTLYAHWEKINLKGDINADGKFNISDAESLQKYLLNKTTLTETQYNLADLNADGTVNGFDLALLRQKLLA